jgi:hypothetical protein
MKNLITLFLFILSFHLSAQERTCFTPAQVVPVVASLNPDPLDGDYCVTAYVEVDSDVIQDKGAQGSRTYVEGLLQEVATLYAAQGITVNWEIKYWDNGSPYTANSTSALLSQFRSQTASVGGYDGDVAHLITYRGSGGIAYVDVVCSQSFGHAVSSIRSDYRQYPTYSWSVEVIAHELGHNLGSPHTQSCVWNGNNTAIDGCSPFGTEGGCDDPGFPNGGGTVMSYCHLQSSVGINFLKGFHEQPLALIKNRIANAQCVECTDDPGGPDDPVDPDTCAGNQIIVEIQLDNYAPETSWQVLNGDGAIVGFSEPFDKLQMNTYQSDTLCLPDGCYTFVITDLDGIEGYGCGEGMYIVNGADGEIASGANFTGSESTRFCLGVTPPGGDCEDVTLRADELTDYANQSRFPFATITDIDGGGVEVYGNNWRALEYAYVVTPNTVLTFDAGNVKTGEIQGVALIDNIRGIWPDKSFRFAGTQRWGIPVQQVAEGETATITIPVGQYFTGEVTHLVLISDDDVRGVVRSTWANVELCESDAAPINKAMFSEVQGTAEDEDWKEVKEPPTPYPNPATDTLIMPTGERWEIFSSTGKTKLEGTGDRASLGRLKAGLYFVKQGGKVFTIVKR